MPLRPCLTCGRPSPASRCSTCQAGRERQRGTTTERGYGADHQAKLRDPAFVAATHCAACEQPFTAANPKAGGHATALRHGGTGQEPRVPHCVRCNSGWSRTGL